MATETAKGAESGDGGDRGYGPSALATPANAVTMLRVAATPFVLAAVASRGASWISVALWIVFAGTDGLDGYLARRQGATRSGAFLDPLADKFLVLGALFVLVAKNVFWWLPVALIGARELVISAYRSILGQRGVSIPARRSAKLKTVVQTFAVGFALLPPSAEHPSIATTILWVAVALTLVSGVQYLVDGSRNRHAM
ncbi:MAG: CDP-diacylglycerol--glycerol-3-phosphate 3-phosphatidyltransferase [Actinobacteria bacterium]|nr:CDP-diacylglycerol--glycerol-3-phosphate 3-phosphatidyltransferase [Actinomycetota bacterium]